MALLLALQIPYPIDLGTIVKRLQNGFYRRKQALLWDIRTMRENTEAFNQPGSLIVETMRHLYDALVDMVNRQDAPDSIEDAYPSLQLRAAPEDGAAFAGVEDMEDQQMAEQDEAERAREERRRGKRKRKETYADHVTDEEVDGSADGEEDEVVVKRPTKRSPKQHASAHGADEPRRSRGRPPKFYRDQGTWDYATPWELRIVSFHQALMERPGATIFNAPVDTRIYRDYLDVISSPMDFGTILDRLLSRGYASIDSYLHDIDLVFNNARSYNRGNSQ